jgi:hypothetical protein
MPTSLLEVVTYDNGKLIGSGGVAVAAGDRYLRRTAAQRCQRPAICDFSTTEGWRFNCITVGDLNGAPATGREGAAS